MLLKDSIESDLLGSFNIFLPYSSNTNLKECT